MRKKIKIVAMFIFMMMLILICPKDTQAVTEGKIVFKQTTINIYVGAKATVMDYTFEGDG